MSVALVTYISFAQLGCQLGSQVKANKNYTTLIVTPDTGVADGVTSIIITVIVKDKNDHPIDGKRVELSVSGSNDTVHYETYNGNGTPNFTASGIVRATLTSTSAGLKTITAKIGDFLGDFTLTKTVLFEKASCSTQIFLPPQPFSNDDLNALYHVGNSVITGDFNGDGRSDVVAGAADVGRESTFY